MTTGNEQVEIITRVAQLEAKLDATRSAVTALTGATLAAYKAFNASGNITQDQRGELNNMLDSLGEVLEKLTASDESGGAMTDPTLSLHLLQRQVAKLQHENHTLRGRGSDGGPPGGDGLEKRVEKLEQALPDIRERLVRVETKVDAIEQNMATKADLFDLKADLHKAINDQTWKFMGVATALAGLAFVAARFIPGA